MIRRSIISCLVAVCVCSCRSGRIPDPDPDNSITTDWIKTNGLAMQVTFFPAVLSAKSKDNLYARVTLRNESQDPFAVPKGNAGEDFGHLNINNAIKNSAILMRENRRYAAPRNKPDPGNYCVLSPGQTFASTGLLGILRRSGSSRDPRPVLVLNADGGCGYRVRSGLFAGYFTRTSADRFFLVRGARTPDDVQNMAEAVGAPAWEGHLRTPSVVFRIKK